MQQQINLLKLNALYEYSLFSSVPCSGSCVLVDLFGGRTSCTIEMTNTQVSLWSLLQTSLGELPPAPTKYVIFTFSGTGTVTLGNNGSLGSFLYPTKTAQLVLTAGTYYLNGGNPVVTRNQSTTLLSTSFIGQPSPTSLALLKTSSATLLAWNVYSNANDVRYFQLFNLATAPTSGSVPVLEYQIPPLNSVTGQPGHDSKGSEYYGNGYSNGFEVGMGWAVSTTSGELTPASATDCSVEVQYE